MIVKIPESGFTVDLLNNSVYNYLNDPHRQLIPEYCLINPIDYSHIIIDLFNNFQYSINGVRERDDVVKYTLDYRGIKLLRSVDVKPGQFILCGA